MSDLVERLRSTGAGGWNAEAADEIDRLKEALEGAIASSNNWKREFFNMVKQRNTAEVKLASARKALEDLHQKAGVVAAWLNHWDVSFADQEEWRGPTGDGQLFFDALNRVADAIAELGDLGK